MRWGQEEYEKILKDKMSEVYGDDECLREWMF